MGPRKVCVFGAIFVIFCTAFLSIAALAGEEMKIEVSQEATGNPIEPYGTWIWVIKDMKTGEPIPDVILTVMVDDKVIRRGETDDNGELKWTLQHSMKPIYLMIGRHPDYKIGIIDASGDEPKWNFPYGLNQIIMLFVPPKE